MKILFLTLAGIDSVYQRGNYSDLIREFRNRGCEIITVTPAERRYYTGSSIIKEGLSTILRVWTPNIQKTNLLEKTISFLLIQYLYMLTVTNFLKNSKIDLIIYSTPPITFNMLIGYYKKKYNAKTYLLLKDIFPQNAVDLGLIRQESLAYKYFKRIEKDLYKLSDYIGTMSRANTTYLLKHNPEINPSIVEINSNSIEVVRIKDRKTNQFENMVPFNEKCVFIYGGNLGRPQKIDFLLEAIKKCQHIRNAFFIIVGSGTDLGTVEKWFEKEKPSNALVLRALPQNKYEELLKLCDVGLIFLHPDFTIPNYPSRLLYYLLYCMPVLCATDKNTDIGKDAVNNNYGFWCENGDISKFCEYVEKLSSDKNLLKEYGKNAFKYLSEHFNSKNSADIILNHFIKK